MSVRRKIYESELCICTSVFNNGIINAIINDTQLYNPVRKDTSNVSTLVKCLEDINGWMITIKLKLNGKMAEVITFSYKSRTFPLDSKHFNCVGKEILIPSSNVVGNLGIYFDEHLSMFLWKTQAFHFHLKYREDTS